jgi:hypothetical protein
MKQKAMESDYTQTREDVKANMEAYHKMIGQWLQQGVLFRSAGNAVSTGAAI